MSTYRYNRFIYWVPAVKIDDAKQSLGRLGYKLNKPMGSQCEVLKTSGKKLGFASPDVFSRLCKRQGSWYRNSVKNGCYLIVSDHRLNSSLDQYLDAEMTNSDFRPESLPDKESLQSLVDSKEYQSNRPDEWERPGLKDSLMFKTMFTVTGFWGWGENLKTSWLNHRANHANFLAKQYTVEIEGEQVPYTVSENKDVCSSCVEFFNIVSGDARKLVRGCPGSITLAGVKRDVYYDIKPVS